MKVLITGGAGFLGTRLARTLLSRGHFSGHPLTQLVLADLAPPAADVAGDPRVLAWTGALLDQCKSLGGEAFDMSSTSLRRSQRSAKPISTLGCALTSTLPVPCSTVYARGQAALVFSSSVAVFGGDADFPLPG